MDYRFFKNNSNEKLFDNQRNNANKLFQRPRAFLTDKCGSGKTMSVLSAFGALKEVGKVKNMLVMTPASAYEKKVWKMDIDKFMNLSCIDIETFFKEFDSYPTQENFDELLDKYDVIYCKIQNVNNQFIAPLLYDLIKVDSVLFVIDEVHAFKNPTAKQTKNLLQLLGKDKKYFWGMTGTPLSKNIEDTYWLINLVYPGYLGNYWEFRNKYCVVKEEVVGRFPNGTLKKVKKVVGVKNNDEFVKKLEPILVQGSSFIDLNYHYIDYVMSEDETEKYTKIANGINLNPDLDDEDWLQAVLDGEIVPPDKSIKDVDKFSSRFIYLQSAADGILTGKGEQTNCHSTKIDMLVELLREKVLLGESVLVYFDYHATLQAVNERLVEENLDCILLESSGKHTLDNSDLTEDKVKVKPHIVLCTKASAESASYYFINNTVFFHIPTVPHTFSQFNGRITRKNTLFPDDLNCYIFRNNNIDMYKMYLVSSKAYQMEIVAGEDKNIPPTYKKDASNYNRLQYAKRFMLWQKDK